MSRDLAENYDKTAQYVDVIVDETVVLDKCGEYILRGKINKKCECKDNENYLYISDRNRLSKRNILAAEALYNGKLISSGYIMVRIINPIKQQNIIYKGTKLGKLEPLSTKNVSVIDNGSKTNSSEVISDIMKAHSDWLTENELRSLKMIMTKFRSIFSRSSTDVGLIKGYEHVIDTKLHRPIAMNPRRVPVNLEDKVDALVNDLEKKDIIEKVESPWNSAIVVVPKKNGDIRLCVDYRQLNSATERPIYHIPDAKELFDTLDGSEYFSTLDLSMGYHQIKMNEADRLKTAFTTKKGQFCFKRMPFGLCGAPQSFQRVMAAILREQNWKYCVIYLDDILIFGRNLKEHNERLCSVLQCLSKAGVKLSPKKCFFMRKEVSYLGHVINKDGIRTDPEKLEKIRKWPIPKTTKELKTFISLCGYYRKFIKNFAEIVRPLELLCQDRNENKNITWNDDYSLIWNNLKKCLCNAPVLSFPQKEGTFILDTDASHDSTGAVLSQIQNGSERVISYASHAFSKHEREYCVTRKELLAVYKYARHFKHYLIGKKFIIRTDHRALIWMLNWKKPNTSQYCSWKAELELFDFEIQHRKGKEHTNADAMSRFPHCNQCEVGHENPKKKTNVKIIANVEEIEKDAVKIIVEMLKTNDGNRIPRQWIRKMDKEMSQILKFKDNLYILEGKKLMLKRENCELEIPVRKKRNHIIDEAHKSLGHPGMFRMIGVIKEKYYWPSMETDIIFYTNRCNLCQIYKSQSSPKRTRSKLIARFPFDKIAIDITGPVRMSKSRNQYILGIIDHYSKYVALVPLKTTDTKTIIEALFSKWISVFGYPRSIHSDRGTNLNSSQMLQLCKELGIRKTSTTPYYPQGDGIIERLFRTVKPMLSIVTEENGIEWDKALPVVEFGIRNTRSRQTGYTPNEILFGRNLYHTATNESKDCAYQNHSNYVEILLRKQKIIENYVNEKNGRLCEEEQADVFKKGDWVWVKRIGSRSGSVLFDGPYYVEKPIGRNAYRIRIGNGKSIDRNALYLKQSYTMPRDSDISGTSITSDDTVIQNRTGASEATIGGTSMLARGAVVQSPPEAVGRVHPQRRRRPPERLGMDT